MIQVQTISETQYQRQTITSKKIGGGGNPPRIIVYGVSGNPKGGVNICGATCVPNIPNNSTPFDLAPAYFNCNQRINHSSRFDNKLYQAVISPLLNILNNGAVDHFNFSHVI